MLMLLFIKRIQMKIDSKFMIINQWIWIFFSCKISSIRQKTSWLFFHARALRHRIYEKWIKKKAPNLDIHYKPFIQNISDWTIQTHYGIDIHILGYQSGNSLCYVNCKWMDVFFCSILSFNQSLHSKPQNWNKIGESVRKL